MARLSLEHGGLGSSRAMGWGLWSPHPVLMVVCCLVLIIGPSCQRSHIEGRSQSWVSSIPQMTASIPTTNLSYGIISGRIKSYQSPLNGKLFVYLARIKWGPDGRIGAYVLDSSVSLWTPVSDDGYFYLNIPPGDYVVFVGTSMESAIPLQESKDKLYIVRIVAGQTLDIGTWMLPSP